MNAKDWAELYNTKVSWAIRMLQDADERNLTDEKEEWIKALFVLNKMDYDIFNEFYSAETQKLSVTYEQWDEFCHRYIAQARENSAYKSALAVFLLWQSGNHYFSKNKKIKKLYDHSAFERDITEEECEYALKHLTPTLNDFQKEVHKNTTWYNIECKVLTYRGINAPIDAVWHCAHILDDKGEERQFSLNWDWWYPIDEYLDLQKGWKE